LGARVTCGGSATCAHTGSKSLVRGRGRGSSRLGRPRTWGLRTPAIPASTMTGGGCRARSGRQSYSCGHDDVLFFGRLEPPTHLHDAAIDGARSLAYDDERQTNNDLTLLYASLSHLRTTRSTDTHIISIKPGYLAFTLTVDDDSSSCFLAVLILYCTFVFFLFWFSSYHIQHNAHIRPCYLSHPPFDRPTS